MLKYKKLHAPLCPTTPSHFPEVNLATILDVSSDIYHISK